ncbi:MAG: acetylxylan esterase [Pirellulaceae bacterium]|nr:acetylxylan esterase [Pirellulaceae bacterium]
MRAFFIGLGLAALWTLSVHEMVCGEDLTCLKTEENGAGQSLSWYSHLKQQAHTSLGERLRKVEALKSAEQISEYQKGLREFFMEQLGGFPERCPLDGQVTGTIKATGYRIENVIFNSQPQHHITANLYIPDGAGPFPGVIVSSGHSRTAKTADYNQRFGIILAQHGMFALCYDPIGQGERSQTLTAEGQPLVSGTVTEHFMVGTGSILVGRNTATYRVWDAMRALDYLESRAEVDAKRLGMTGCSGGGTLTSYTMALDPRIKCAAPACYLTTLDRLIDTSGPQDAEQNIFGQLARGLDQPDYVILRAPQPTLISSTTNDFFDIGGSWENLRQSKRIYARLGASERVDLVEADGAHGVQPANLAAIAQWMQRWLVGKDAPVPVQEFAKFDIKSEKELLCTQRGQVLLLPGEKSVYDLNAELAQQLAAQRVSKRAAGDSTKLLADVRAATGVRAADTLPKPTSNRAGKVERKDYHIDKLVIHVDGPHVPLPALTFHPKDPSEAAYLYLHDGGKAADGAEGGPIEKIVQDGYVVVSVDLSGQGETADGKPDASLGDWKSFYMAYLMGQSTVGRHTEDILAAADWVANYQSKQPREVHLIANGRTCVAALHAAALNPTRFTTVKLNGAPESWTTIAGSAKEAHWLTATVHGALRSYDLPDLMQVIAGKLAK